MLSGGPRGCPFCSTPLLIFLGNLWSAPPGTPFAAFIARGSTTSSSETFWSTNKKGHCRNARMTKREITLAHSPDSDDAFMFYALATNKVDSEKLVVRHHLNDIETLNREAKQGVWDVTAISFHALPYITKHYALMPCGGSM